MTTSTVRFPEFKSAVIGDQNISQVVITFSRNVKTIQLPPEEPKKNREARIDQFFLEAYREAHRQTPTKERPRFIAFKAEAFPTSSNHAAISCLFQVAMHQTSSSEN